MFHAMENLVDRLKMLLSFCGQLKSRKTPLNLCVRVPLHLSILQMWGFAKVCLQLSFLTPHLQTLEQ